METNLFAKFPMPTELNHLSTLSLFLKLNLAIIFIILITSLILSTSFSQFEKDRSLAKLKEKAIVQINSLANKSGFDLSLEQADELRTKASELLADPDILYVSASNQQGNFSIQVNQPDFTKNITPLAAQPRNQIDDLLVTETASATDNEVIIELLLPYYTQSTLIEDDELSILENSAQDSLVKNQKVGYYQLGVTSKNLNVELEQFQQTLLLITILVIALTSGLSLMLTQFLTRPLNELLEGIVQVSQGAFDHQLKISTRDEIGRLAKAFNEMTTRLKKTTVSKNYVDNILESMSDTLVVLDPQLTIQTVNRALCTMLNYQQHELIGKPFSSLLSTDYLAKNNSANSATLSAFFNQSNEANRSLTSQVTNIETSYQTAASKLIPVLFSGATMINDDGELSGYVCMAQDITLLRDTQQKLERAKTLAEKANSAKSEFLANMSHELRTPLNAILGYTQILQKQSLSPAQFKGVKTIEQSGDHLLALINDILDLSKIEAGKMEFNAAPFSLHQLLKRINDIFKIRAKQQNIAFELEPIDSIADSVMGDEKKIMQILMNLLSNAIKFTEKGGVVLKVGSSLDKVRFQVEDSGCGIDQSSISKIFESFKQLTPDDFIEGTGLGLPISQKLAHLMDSKIGVSSTLNQGSKFWFEISLPAVSKLDGDDTCVRQVTNYLGKRRKILIVDDKQFNRELLETMLQPIGFLTRLASDGQQAINECEGWQPDLLLMDLRMPVMDGITAIEKIRQNPKFQQLKIITVSASAFELNRNDSIEHGSDAFIAKPFREVELLDNIQRLLSIEWIFAEGESAQMRTSESWPLANQGSKKQDSKKLMSTNHPTATDDSPLSKIDLSKRKQPANEHLLKLNDFALSGNLDRIKTYIVSLEQKYPAEYQSNQQFYRQVNTMAHGFKIKELQKLFAQFLTA